MARITLEQAESILAACKAEAQQVGQPMNIAVVDDAGHLVAFAAMDETKLAGNEISRNKAMSTVYFQEDTRDMAEVVQPGQPVFGLQTTHGGRLVAFGGGVLLRTADGAVAGGIGVSAGSVEEDHQVADAGRRAFAGSTEGLSVQV